MHTSFQYRLLDSLAWSSFVFLYDSSISAEARKRIMAEIERDEGRTFSFHDLGDTAQVDRAKLNMLFGKIPFRDMGGKFILAVSKDIVSTVLEEVSLKTVLSLFVCGMFLVFQIQARLSGLVSINAQWLFLIPDTNEGDTKILSELQKSIDGDNVAFIYNSSVSAPTCNVLLNSTS